MTLRLVPLLAAILWALTAKAPRPLKYYFGAQLFNTLLVFISYDYMGQTAFIALYFLGLVVIAYAMAQIVLESKKGWGAFLFSGGLCLAFTVAACFGIKEFDAGALSGIVEGGLLTFCGTALALSVPRSKYPNIPAALVCLWLVLAFFDYAYALSVNGTELWNLWFRTFAVIVAMLYLGNKLRKVPASQ